jgi:protein-tyrosine phosphatase
MEDDTCRKPKVLCPVFDDEPCDEAELLYPWPPGRKEEERAYVQEQINQMAHKYDETKHTSVEPVSMKDSGYVERLGYCNIVDRLYLGNQATANAIARDDIVRLTNKTARETPYRKFGAVFNASGSEQIGNRNKQCAFSLHAHYSRLGIAYDTIMDEHSLVIGDDPVMETPDLSEIAKHVEYVFDPVKGLGRTPVLVAEYPRPIFENTVPYATRKKEGSAKFLRHLLYEAADRLRALLLEYPTRNVLVHCFGGFNRSAAAVVAYMVLYHPVWKGKTQEAIDHVRTIQARERGDKEYTLSNKNFVLQLKNIHLEQREEHELQFQEEYASFMRVAIPMGILFGNNGVPIGFKTTNVVGTCNGPMRKLGVTIDHPMVIFRACVVCGSVDKEMYMCGACKDKSRPYCSIRCQLLDLKMHKHCRF